MGKQNVARGVCGVLGMLGVASAASAEVIEFRNGASNALVTNYGGTEDTFLNNNEGTTHTGYGSITASLTGRETVAATGLVTYRTALVRFDLSALQGQYSTINSATLTLYQAETGVQFPDFEFGLHEVSAANGGWVEGTFADGVAGNPDWEHLSHDTQTWAGSAGLQTAGVDYIAPAFATGTYQAGGAGSDRNGTPYAFAVPAAMIAKWANGDNPGVVLQKSDLTTDGLFQFRTSEFTTASLRPMLTVDYTPIPEPAGLAVLGLAGLALRRRRRGC